MKHPSTLYAHRALAHSRRGKGRSPGLSSRVYHLAAWSDRWGRAMIHAFRRTDQLCFGCAVALLFRMAGQLWPV